MERGQVSFGAIENCPHFLLIRPSNKDPSMQEEVPQFPIYLDNFLDFNILSPRLSDSSGEVFERVVVEESMAPAEPQEDKAAFKANMMRLKNPIRTYGPIKHSAQDLVINKEKWVGAVKTVYENKGKQRQENQES